MTDHELRILASLSMTERYGYELHSILKYGAFSPGSGEIAQSSVYALLRRLLEKGYLVDREVPQSGKPPRKLYGISPSGRYELENAVERMLNSEDPPIEQFGAVLLAWAIFSDEKRGSMLGRYDRALKGRSDLLENRVAGEINPVSAALIDRELTRIRAEIEWLERFARKIGIAIADLSIKETD